MGKKARERREKWDEIRRVQESREVFRKSRFIDEILLNPERFDLLTHPEMYDWLSSAVVIVADNIHSDAWEDGLHDDNWFPLGAGGKDDDRYYPMLDDEAVMKVWLENLKAPVKPPFQYTFIEWIEPDDLEVDGWIHYHRFCHGVLFDASEFYSDEGRGDSDLLPTVCCHVFYERGVQTVFVDYDPNSYVLKTITPVGETAPLRDDPMFVSSLYKALKTVCILNCKNIQVDDVEPKPENTRAFQRFFNRPLTKYKSLKIGSIGKRSVSDTKEYQGVIPLHIRRGNFAHYTDESPLFGKFTGTFWRPATVVGNEKRGVVVKDYDVDSKS